MKRRLLSLLLAISCLLVLGGTASAAAVTRAGELGQPQGVKATAISTSEILVEWEEVDGADSYEVQCATSTAFSPATTKTTTDADYTFTGLTLGTTYYFRVRALKGGTGYAYSSTVNAYPAPEGPADLEAEVKTGSSITLTWDSVSSITGYSVRRSTDGANFTRVGDVKSGVTTYTDTGLTAGTKYYYRLYTYKTSGDDTADSVEYAEVEIEMIPPTPTNFKATAITNGFRLSWSAVADVSYYTIYRSVNDGADGYPVLATNLTGTSYDDTRNIRIGMEYKYYIVAVKDSVSSSASVILTASGQPVAPTGLSAKYDTSNSTAINVSWNAVEDVTGYILEYSDTSKNGPFAELTRGFITSYKDTGVTVGKGRFYRVRTYVGDVQSDATSPVFDAARPAAVKNFKLTNASSKAIKLTWNLSDGAAGYRVYRGTSSNSLSLVTTLAATKKSYTDKKLTLGTTYYYRLEPYILDPRDGKTIMPGTSVEGNLQVVPPAPEILDVQQSGRKNALKVTWEAVSGGSGYRVYYRVTGDTDYILAATVADTKTAATITGLKPGTMYDIAVRKTYTLSGKTALGAIGKMNGVTLKVKAPNGLSWTPVDLTSLSFTWTAVAGVDGYEVTVTGAQDDYSLSTSTTTTSVTLEGLTAGYDYECKVRAYSNVGGGKVNSAWSAAITLTPTSPIPTSLTAKASTSKYTVALSWGAAAGADGYYIQRSTKKDSGFTQIARINSGSTTSYTDTLTAADVEKTYYYRINSYVDAMGALNQSPWSGVVSATLSTSVPTAKIAAASPTAITVKWSKVTGADGYMIYRSTKPDQGFELIKKITSASTVKYKNTGLTTGTKYYYKVTSYRVISKKTVQSGDSNVVSLTAAPKAPTNLAATPSATSVKLTWTKSSGATGYYVYRAVGSGAFTKVATVTATSYTDQNLTTGTTYKYQVSAYTQVGKVIGEGPVCKAVSAKTAVSKVKSLKSTVVSESSLKLTWKAVADAESYQVQMATSQTGSYSLVTTVEKTEATVTGLPTAAYRYFRVRAVVKGVAGSWSTVVKGYAAPKAPANLKATAGKTTVTLNWSASAGATGYRVYQKAPGESKYTLISTLQGKNATSYQVTGLTKNKSYSYKVAAIAENASGKVFKGLTTKVLKVKTKK